MAEVCFSVENTWIERRIYLEHGVPKRSCIRNKISGAVWETDGKEPIFALKGICLEGSQVTLEAETIIFSGADYEIRWEVKPYESLPMIESRLAVKGCARRVPEDEKVKDYSERIGSEAKHLLLKTVQFHDCTDHTDCLIEERTVPLYASGMLEEDGHLFVLQDMISGDECLIVKNAPCRPAYDGKCEADIQIRTNGSIGICGSGINTCELSEDYLYSYSVAIGVCGRNQSNHLFRQYYKQAYPSKVTYTMSNTWGDRNCDKCICEEFVLQEIERAGQLGLDVVQIDDGWQTGITANSILEKGGCWSGGYRNAKADFWKIHSEKFPNGFERIIQAASDKKITLGLWFSPDNYQDYESWEADADEILNLYHRYGIRYFKIDGVMIENRICERNLLRLFQKVQRQSDGKIVFNMDITAGKRFGYLLHREYGDIFVENRYTDFASYYPHNTLRNLWELSEYIPTCRLQMELLNHKRNQNCYHDILAPVHYDADYLFASVMVSNPLLWMEVSGLDADTVKRLAKIIAIYKRYRGNFRTVYPILEKPTGFSRTGFMIKGETHDYVLLFRELSEKEEFPYKIKTVLASNDPGVQLSPVRLSKKRSYVFGILHE